jgi:hypothetical protein
MQPARSPALRRVHPFKAYLEDVMAARRTGSRIIGIALAGLLVSSTAGAQILFGGSAAGCYGLVCMPLTSFVTLPGTSVSPRWETFTGWTNPTEFAISQNQNARGDQDENGQGEFPFNKTAAASTGVAFTLFFTFLNTSLVTSHGGDGFVSLAAPPALATPVNAHLEFGETSVIDTNPEPATLVLTATGLLALGAVLRRRRRRHASV